MKAFSMMCGPETCSRNACLYPAIKSLRLQKGSLRVYQQKMDMSKTGWWSQVTNYSPKQVLTFNYFQLRLHESVPPPSYNLDNLCWGTVVTNNCSGGLKQVLGRCFYKSISRQWKALKCFISLCRYQNSRAKLFFQPIGFHEHIYSKIIKIISSINYLFFFPIDTHFLRACRLTRHTAAHKRGAASLSGNLQSSGRNRQQKSNTPVLREKVKGRTYLRMGDHGKFPRRSNV